jgi:alpha-1,3-rhamnosyltransferase
MCTPLVSIVIPSFNHERYIKDCIESVIGQSYENIELIIIDDGSRDCSAEKIKELEIKCINRFKRFEFRCRENKGLCATLNEGIEWCEGKYYCAIASDDLMLPQKTSKQVEYLEKNPDCAAVFGGLQVIDSIGTVFRTKSSKAGSYRFSDIFLVKHSFATPTQMIRLDALKNAGLYPDGLYIEDWYMWLKLSHGGARLDDLGEVLSAYRRHGSNMSSQLAKMDRARSLIIDLYKNNELYVKALAISKLSSAMDVQLVSKIIGLKYIGQALSISFYPIITDKRFYKFVAKCFIPTKILTKSSKGEFSDELP